MEKKTSEVKVKEICVTLSELAQACYTRCSFIRYGHLIDAKTLLEEAYLSHEGDAHEQ